MNHTDSVHFRNIQKDAGCSSNSWNPYWVVLVPLGKIPQELRNLSESVSYLVAVVCQNKEGVAGFAGVVDAQHAVQPIGREAVLEWQRLGRTGATEFLYPHEHLGMKSEHADIALPVQTPESSRRHRVNAGLTRPDPTAVQRFILFLCVPAVFRCWGRFGLMAQRLPLAPGSFMGYTSPRWLR